MITQFAAVYCFFVVVVVVVVFVFNAIFCIIQAKMTPTFAPVIYFLGESIAEFGKKLCRLVA